MSIRISLEGYGDVMSEDLVVVNWHYLQIVKLNLDSLGGLHTLDDYSY